MDVQELKGLRRKLDAFARRFDACIKTQPSRKHMRTYLSAPTSLPFDKKGSHNPAA